MTTPEDVVEGRRGAWMNTSLGGRYFPEDPRPEEIFISNIANGLAEEQRYGGGKRIDVIYTVAEHSCHLSDYALWALDSPMLAWAMLMHDGAEGLGLKDLPRAVKIGAGAGYRKMTEDNERIMFQKYGLFDFMQAHKDEVKELDCRIVPVEKKFVMRYQQPWAFDAFVPLKGIEIQGWSHRRAKIEWLSRYVGICDTLNMTPEEYEI